MHAERGGLAGQRGRVRGVVGPGVGDDVRVATDLLEHRLEQRELLGVGERRRLAGRAREHEPVAQPFATRCRASARRGTRGRASRRRERRDHRGQDAAERGRGGLGGTREDCSRPGSRFEQCLEPDGQPGGRSRTRRIASSAPVRTRRARARRAGSSAARPHRPAASPGVRSRPGRRTEWIGTSSPVSRVTARRSRQRSRKAVELVLRVQLDDLDARQVACRLCREAHREHCADREVRGVEDGTPAARADASNVHGGRVDPGRPEHERIAARRHAVTVDSSRSGRAKSHTTSGCAASSAIRSPKPSPPAARLGAMRATSSRSPAAATPSATGLPSDPSRRTRGATRPRRRRPARSDRPRRQRRRTRPRPGRCRRPRDARARRQPLGDASDAICSV